MGSVSFAWTNLLFNAKDFTCYEIKYIIQKSTVGILISSQNQIYKIRQKKQGEKYNEMDDCIRYTWFRILLREDA